ncbi:MAG TPA: cation diffusion facilitator family transporter [Longimicrobiaceae bacterium]|nr:cation diffusion facilitator family transporter [Longimicrobiaceae bacterium]
MALDGGGGQLGVEERARRVRRTLQLMLLVNFTLLVVKAVAGVRSGSLAVLGGAFDSGLDMITNVVGLTLAGMAAQGPDEDHPYGHDKFETLGALVLVAFLSVSVYELVRSAIGRLRGGTPVELDTSLAVAVMTGSLVVGMGAAVYERRRGRALQSELLVADSAHLLADVGVTTAALVGLLLTRAGWEAADALTSLLIAGLIARTGWEIIREAVPMLVDERAVDAGEIARVAEGMEGVHAVYDVRSRGRRGSMFAELTIAVGSGVDVETAHAIADLVERELRQRLGAQSVTVHVEPEPAG